MTSRELNLSAEQKELVAVGASVGAGCRLCVSHHLKAGAGAGLEGEQLLAAATPDPHHDEGCGCRAEAGCREMFERFMSAPSPP